MKETSHRKTNIVRVHLYKASRIGKFVEMESRMVTVRGLGERREGLLFNGYRVSIFKMKDLGDGCRDGCPAT